MSKEKIVINNIKRQLEQAIDDATSCLDDLSCDNDLGIYEGRKELAEQLLEYLEENKWNTFIQPLYGHLW